MDTVSKEKASPLSPFRHLRGENEVSEELAITPFEPNPYLIFTLSMSSPKANQLSTFQLPRFRVKALHHWLGQWLERTPEEE
jgi:hypothetical protein